MLEMDFQVGVPDKKSIEARLGRILVLGIQINATKISSLATKIILPSKDPKALYWK